MADWFGHLAAWQGEIVRTLAAELRSGGLMTAVLAFALGALHALTPGTARRRWLRTFWEPRPDLAKVWRSRCGQRSCMCCPALWCSWCCGFWSVAFRLR